MREYLNSKFSQHSVPAAKHTLFDDVYATGKPTEIIKKIHELLKTNSNGMDVSLVGLERVANQLTEAGADHCPLPAQKSTSTKGDHDGQHEATEEEGDCLQKNKIVKKIKKFHK